MIENILKFYGINFNNKWFGFFTTGLTLSAFSTTLCTLIFFKSSDNEIRDLLLKLLFSVHCASKLINYLLIKYKSSELFELNNKLREYQNKCSISQLNIYIFSSISLIISVFLALLSTIFYFCQSYSDQSFEGLNEQIVSLKIPPFLPIFVLNFYLNSWNITIQLFYMEFKTRYISIIKEFNKEVMNEKSKPDSDVLVLTQKFVIEFVHFKSDIKTNVDFLKYGISVEFFCSFCLTLISIISRSECYYLGITRIFLISGCYLFTMSSNLRIRIVENNLSLNLNRWLNLNDEHYIRIEMDYIEKTVKRLNEKEANDELNAI